MPGRRLVFNRCTLIKRTVYEATFRDAATLVWRHVFESPDYPGRIVYSGAMLNMREGETRTIKATIKREETPRFSDWKFLRISRPRLLDVKTLPLIERL